MKRFQTPGIRSRCATFFLLAGTVPWLALVHQVSFADCTVGFMRVMATAAWDSPLSGVHCQDIWLELYCHKSQHVTLECLLFGWCGSWQLSCAVRRHLINVCAWLFDGRIDDCCVVSCCVCWHCCSLGLFAVRSLLTSFFFGPNRCEFIGEERRLVYSVK